MRPISSKLKSANFISKIFTSAKHASMLFILAITVSGEASAKHLDSFLKFAQRNGSMTSINKGGVIEDQRAGYITGGSVITRGPKPQDLQPLSVQLPSMSFDPCTGSGDFRWGGFSYIKSDQIVKFLKGVAKAGSAYALKMAIKSINAQSENIIADLEAIARDINGKSLNQCGLGKSIAQGVLGRFNSAATQKCLAKSAKSAADNDLFASTEKCEVDPYIHGDKGDSDVFKSVLPDNYNLVWKALSHGDGKSDDTTMRELIMSISGSIIGEKKGDTPVIRSLPSLVEKEDLMEQYIGRPGTGSSKIKLYVCNEKGRCLSPSVTEKDVSNADTLYGKVEKSLQSIISKISANKGDLTDDEQALIEYSTIPLITLFEIELALKNEESVANLAGDSEFIEVVCYDMVTNFMRKMLAQARDAVNELQAAQFDNTSIDRFNKNVANVQLMLRDKKYEAMKKLQTIVAVKERLSQQQKVFKLGFTRFADN